MNSLRWFWWNCRVLRISRRRFIAARERVLTAHKAKTIRKKLISNIRYHKTAKQKKKSKSRIIYPDKLSFRGEGKLKIFSHIKWLREFISTDGPTLTWESYWRMSSRRKTRRKRCRSATQETRVNRNVLKQPDKPWLLPTVRKATFVFTKDRYELL